jgi:hypothetical protein
MLQQLIERGIESQERQLGVPLEYLRHIARHSPGAVAKLGLLRPLAGHHHKLPLDALHVARLQATLVEDCGESAQVEVILARRNGVAQEVIQAVLAQRLEDLPEEMADVARFAWAVADGTSDPGHLRERLRARYGEDGLIELAVATATVRVYPALKRALGFGHLCPLRPVAIPN